MRPDPHWQAGRWRLQAERDLAAGETLLAQGFYSHACFLAQQSAEKSLKALAYLIGADRTKGRQASGSTGLLQVVVIPRYPSFRQFEEDAGILDQFYIATRYPDALPSSAVPYQVYPKSQAVDAIERATRIVKAARETIDRGKKEQS